MPSLAFLPNLAGGPGLIILLIVIVLFGAKRLPELGKSLGASLREFSKGKEESEDKDKKDGETKTIPPVPPKP
jgi:sec-independent protein translocase protein TatA